MERKKFLKTCGCAIIGAPMAAQLLQSCTTLHYASFERKNDKLVVPTEEFKTSKDKQKRDFVLLDSENLKFPICIFRTDEGFTASYMKCTHKGCEVNVSAGRYSCPCHGSQFSKTGSVIEGPADRPLRTFKTTTHKNNIYVHIS